MQSSEQISCSIAVNVHTHTVFQKTETRFAFVITLTNVDQFLLLARPLISGIKKTFVCAKSFVCAKRDTLNTFYVS